MMKFIFKILFVAGSLILADFLVGGFTIDQFWPTAIIASLALGILNGIVKPILKVLALPITILTLGLFSGLLNVLLFLLLTFIPGVSIDGFFSAVLALLVVSIVGWIIDIFFK
ncbi:MAG: hypothetical protein CR972_01215 [Candidatus Moraniibacteriota bacterium]|nr:MAG: hypothetical protein CR972_01215 [Candidatus Moranbacteria bacterium]